MLMIEDEDWPDLIMFEKWLPRMAFVREGFSSSEVEGREEHRRITYSDERFSKTSHFSACSNVRETKQVQSDHCPLADVSAHVSDCTP